VSAPVAAVAAPVAAVEPEPTPEPTPEPEVVHEEPAPVAAVSPAPVSNVDDEDEATTTTNLLQLARRLHEEHVREGVEKRDSLIADAHATAARLLAEAEAQQRAQVATMEEERAQLEARIDELRIFEREYRQKLKSYIESQLRELDSPQAALAGNDSSGSNFSGFAGK
ncbi:MAG TPA: cell division protein, partial [Glaciihabitans sp.]|nr:cell division protein [Glaciihabitans sp.]